MDFNSANYFLKGKVGQPTPSNDSTEQVGRLGRLNDFIVSELQGRYYEGNKRGNVYGETLGATSTAIAAGQVVGAAAALSVQFTVWNPSNSGKDMVLLKLNIGFISGTLPVVPIYHSIYNASAVSVTPSQKITGQYGGLTNSVMKDWVSAGGAALLGAGAATTIRASSINFTAGTLAQLYPANVGEVFDGDIIIPPGYGYIPLWASAASLLNSYSLTWAEVPV